MKNSPHGCAKNTRKSEKNEKRGLTTQAPRGKISTDKRKGDHENENERK